MRRAVVSFLPIFFWALTPLWAAEETTFSVKAEVDKAFITIGERVEYRVTITHDPSVEILSQIVPPPSTAFEVKEAHDFSEPQGRQLVEGRRFVLTAYELGEFILDPVSLRYRTPQGKEEVAETNRLYLTVRSIDPSGRPKTDIRGAKGVLELPRRWRWLVTTVLLLTAVLGGLLFWRRWKRRSQVGEGMKEPALSPEDEALLRLNRLFDSDLIRRGKMKEYFLELSEILKHYFERRFEIQAAESTTSEILRDLREKEVPEGLRDKIQRVLEVADLVKFAKWRPASPEILQVNQKAKQVVEEARPKTPTVEETLSPSTHGV